MQDDQSFNVKFYICSKTHFSHRETVDQLKLKPATLKQLSVLGVKNNSTGCFSFPLKNYQEVVRAFRDLQPDLRCSSLPMATVNGLIQAAGFKELPQEEYLKYVPRNILEKLFDYQKEGVAYGLSRGGRVLLADEMGVGKSFQGLALLGAYMSEWPAAIICPASLKGQWYQLSEQYLKPALPVELQSRCTKKVKDARDPLDACINIMSYDIATSKADDIGAKAFKVVLLDESHFIKGRTTDRAKKLLPQLGKSKRIILLSGTPSLSRPSEIFTQVSMLRRDVFSNFHAFGERYCGASRNRFGWSYDGAANLDELNVVLESLCMICRKKSEVLSDLPPKTRERVLLTMSPEQLLVVEKSMHHLREVEKKKDTIDPITRKAAFMSLWRDVGTAKIPSVIEYMNKMLENESEKFLVFSHHQNVLDELEFFLRKKQVNYIRIDGKTKEEHRTRMVKEFQDIENENGPQVALLSIMAVGMGVTLTAANTVLFAELYWTPGALLQAEDRVHRVGQTRPVTIKYLIAKATADEKIWWMLEKKIAVLGDMMGNSGARLGGQRSEFDEDLKQTDMQEFLTAILGEEAVVNTIPRMMERNAAKRLKQASEPADVINTVPSNWEDITKEI
jgi:SWI/SNF-related matrix-associated actin-dependent regulator 1 of chromatin subfamily A